MDGGDGDDHDMLFGVETPAVTPYDFTRDDPQPDRRDKSENVVAQIESVFETVADALLNERAEVSISLTANSSHNTEITKGRIQRAAFSFPGKTPAEAWRFSVVLRLLELIHESICGGVVLTKRDLYYRDPALFGKQSTVDRYINQIATAFAVPRSALNVTAGVKGLMAGAAVLHRRNGSKIDLENVQNGIFVPSIEDVLSVDLSRVRWILVIEKEATFQSIISSAVWEEMRWHSVLVTGKGYPDFATRAMARFMSVASPQNGFAEPPVFGLMDYDPDGLAILHTYKQGSSRSSEGNDNLVVPAMQWMGIQSRDVTDEDHTYRNQGLMLLTRRDRQKARKMLEWERFVGHEEATQWRRELQVMLLLNLKAEIQLIDSDPCGLGCMIKNAVSHT